LPFSDLVKSRTRTIFLVFIIAGIAIAFCSLAMALTVSTDCALDLYVVESTFMSVGIVMLCMGIILMKNGEGILGRDISKLQEQRMHDDMHDKVMSEMRLSPKDLEIQKKVREKDDELFK
jgi:hypothetical protein